MAKVRIYIEGREPVYFQADNEEATAEYLQSCGYGLLAQRMANWAALSHKPGDQYDLGDLHMCIERGSVETWDVRSSEWAPTPPEMEAFLVDIDAVCRKHGMILDADDAGASGAPVVKPYTWRNRDILEMAKKDYDITEIQKPANFAAWNLSHEAP